MKKNIILLVITGLVLLGLLAIGSALLTPKVSADTKAMEAANRLYQVGNYHEAGRIYEQIINQGVQDSTVYFNLGNAYYRQGDLGRAIVNYQRASLLNPRDADIQANLDLAREQAGIVLGLENALASVPGPLGILLDMTGKWLTVNETAVLALAFWFLAGLLLLGWRLMAPGRGRSTLRLAAVLILFIMLLTGLSLGTRLYAEQTLPGGVVIAPSVAVSTEPGEQFITSYSLQSGTEVSVAETNGNWARLAVPGDAVESWIPLDAVELVASGHLTHGTPL
jgi:hypothetical protein